MKDGIIEKIRQAGVVGAGGAGFPTHVKVNTSTQTVLVNGASCEPLLMSDPYLLEEKIQDVVKGLQAVLDCTGASTGVICLKGKHARAMTTVSAVVESRQDPRIKMFELEDVYPAGDEHVLVNTVLGRTIPEAGLPLDVGAVVCNVESLYNISHAMEDRPVTNRYLTLAGEVPTPMILKVPVGTPVSEVLAFAGAMPGPGFRVVDGGPMMGRVLDNLDYPVTKTTSGLIVLPETHNVVAGKIKDPGAIRKITTSVCCQCSHCTELCPRNLLGHRLHPHKLMRNWSATIDPGIKQEEQMEALLCSECGICEKFACPMGISPREVNAQIKQELALKGIRYTSPGTEPENSDFMKSRQIPTQRLIHRLGISEYVAHPEFVDKDLVPSRVEILLSQHIGAPATAVVAEGDRVNPGDLVADIPDGALGARLHTGIKGIVRSVTHEAVTIERV